METKAGPCQIKIRKAPNSSERRAAEGMILQVDGSEDDWL